MAGTDLVLDDPVTDGLRTGLELGGQLPGGAALHPPAGSRRAAAAFLGRAAALSLDPAKRTERTLAATRATLEAGMPDAAADLVASLDTERLDDPQHASIDLLGGKISLVGGEDGALRGPEFILRAAQRLASGDPEVSPAYFVAALETALVVGRAAGVMDRVLDAARTAPPASRPPDVLDALVSLNTKDTAQASLY